MNQPLDEAQLLALIEDQLDMSAAQRMRQQLASHPELLAQIDRMREDRAAVRHLPEPALPKDLLEALEPALARPMLLAPLSASEYRKQHARSRRPKFARMALAAAVLLVLFAGVWAATGGWLNRKESANTSNGANMSASRTPGEGLFDQRKQVDAAGHIVGSNLEPDMLASAENIPVQDRVTVHHLPPPTDIRLAMVQSTAGIQANTPAEVATKGAATGATTEASFALVIETDDADHAVAQLSQLVEPSKASAALVRNVTEAEVIEYGRMLAARSAPQNDSAPAEASTDADAPTTPGAGISHQRRKIDSTLADAMRQPGVLGEQLAGEPNRAAPVEDQLRYAKSGAQYALTIPSDRLAEVLLAINMASGQTSSLRAMDELNAPAKDKQPRETSVALQWLTQWREIQDSLNKLNLAPGSEIVLPVRIEARSSRTR